MSLSQMIVSLLGAVALASLHLLARPVAQAMERERAWLFAAAGLTVAYAIVHLLPDLGEKQTLWIESRPYRPLRWLTAQVYIAALLGLLIIYALRNAPRLGPRGGFRLDVGVFAAYHVLIGATIARTHGWVAVSLTVLAFGAHFLVNDVSLRRVHKERYERTGPKVFALALLAGWILGVAVPLPTVAGGLVVGLLAGSVLLGIFTEQIPSGHSLRLVAAFVAGAIGYTVLLLVLDYVTAGGGGAQNVPSS